MDSEEGLSQACRNILDERLKYHKENPNDGKSWEEIKAAFLEKD